MIMADNGTVYLIHFDTPLHHARHYLGWTTNLKARLEAHRRGNGARLMEVITEAGITWRLARTWEGGRELERHLKRQKNSPRFCPICQEKGE
jgi:predicted GIY-YIG superfamily endonuclease